jgi:hypothetical protein
MARDHGDTEREYHLGLTFTVRVGSLADPEESWHPELGIVARALLADQPRLDAYLLYRCASALADDGAIQDHTDLCDWLDVPTDYEPVIRHLLGLHLPPATRRLLQDLAGPDPEYAEADSSFLAALEKVIAVEPAGYWLHRAADRDAATKSEGD